MTEQTNYTPPAGYSFLTPLYDIGVRLTTREVKWRKALVGLITPNDNDVLLDVGAGTGSLAPLMAQANPAVTYLGIDPDDNAIEIARAKAQRAGIDVEFKRAMMSADAVADWPAPNIATLCLVLHQVPLAEKMRLLSEIHSVLKPGGSLFVADYGEQTSWLMRKLFRATIQQLDGIADTQPNADGVLIPLMSRAGFVEVRELRKFNTITGSISIISAMKGAEVPDVSAEKQ